MLRGCRACTNIGLCCRGQRCPPCNHKTNQSEAGHHGCRIKLVFPACSPYQEAPSIKTAGTIEGTNVVTAVLHLGTWFSDRRSWTCERWCENGTGSVFSGYIWWSIWMRPWAPRRRTCLRGHRRHGHVKEDTTSLACECPAARSYHGMPPVANSLGEDLDPSATAIDL